MDPNMLDELELSETFRPIGFLVAVAILGAVGISGLLLGIALIAAAIMQ